MKSTFLLTILASAGCGLLLSSCNNSDELVQTKESEILKGIRVTLPESLFASETRTAHSIVSGAMHTDWQLGDTLGIYPIGGDQVAFPISEGEGTSTANFNGGAWALRSSYQYAAYYPFAHKNYDVNDAVLTFDYTGQEQNGDGSLDHLGDYDFLAAGATETNEEGSVDLTLNHLGCFVRMQLTIPEANTLRSVRVASNNTPFIIKGTVDLSTETPSLTSTETSTYVELKLENVTVEADETITLYMMMAPVDLTSSILTFTVSGNGGVSYSQTLSAGKNMEAGKAYNFAVSLDKDDSQYVAVDLGLPSGLKWASFNVGATAPEEYGDYYAWGETETKDNYELKDSYIYYKWFEESTTKDEDGFEIIVPSHGEYVDLGNISESNYDVARQSWGGLWRMPTAGEFQELINYCTWAWSVKNNVNGYKVTGTNGKWIFLPASGYRDGNKNYSWHNYGLQYLNYGGYYWAGTCESIRGYDGYANYLYFYSYDINLNPQDLNHGQRYRGYSVRPVTE